MRTLRRVAVLVAALGGSAFSAPRPITGGTPSDDSAVVAIAHGSVLVCTGTVIASNAVLTAAHCLTDAQLPEVVEGDTLSAGSIHHRVVAAFSHPDFNEDTLENDIAVVIVEAPLSATPIPFATTLPAGAVSGATIRAVGYGWTVDHDPMPSMRRTGISQIDAIEPTKIRTIAAPSQACEGDSGGPALFDDGFGERVIGVTSSGDVTCTQFARFTRVDVFAAFVTDIVARTGIGGAKPGDRCLYEAHCATGGCLPALDEPSWSFCSPLCDDGACPNGLACTVDGGEARCRHPWPSPGADRHACTSNSDCASELCVAAANDEARTVCATRCFSDLPGFDCPVNTVCRGAVDGSEACFAIAEDGGCQVTTDRPGILAMLGAFGVLAMLRGRARRA